MRRDEARNATLFGLLVLFLVAMVELAVGCHDATQAASECRAPWRRYEYVWPVYHIGCWLGEVP